MIVMLGVYVAGNSPRVDVQGGPINGSGFRQYLEGGQGLLVVSFEDHGEKWTGIPGHASHLEVHGTDESTSVGTRWLHEIVRT